MSLMQICQQNTFQMAAPGARRPAPGAAPPHRHEGTHAPRRPGAPAPRTPAPHRARRLDSIYGMSTRTLLDRAALMRRGRRRSAQREAVAWERRQRARAQRARDCLNAARFGIVGDRVDEHGLDGDVLLTHQLAGEAGGAAVSRRVQMAASRRKELRVDEVAHGVELDDAAHAAGRPVMHRRGDVLSAVVDDQLGARARRERCLLLRADGRGNARAAPHRELDRGMGDGAGAS